MICSPQSSPVSIVCVIIAINLIGPTWNRGSGKLCPEPVAAAEAHDNIEQNPAVAAASKYELKFQTELDNSTVIKQAGQQQIFKCQVRLAPIGAASSPANLQQLSTGRPRFKSVCRAIESKKLAQFEDGKSLDLEQIAAADNGGDDNNSSSNNSNTDVQNKWSATEAPLATSMNMIHISIDWFRNEQPIGDKWQASGGERGAGLDEPITVINVTLKSKASKAKIKSRVEIKNTLNGSQLKLTSRLRVSHLRFTDSGRYKCVARASFIINQHQLNNRPILVEQSLESNATTLVIDAKAPSDSSALDAGSGSNSSIKSNLAQQKAANEETRRGGPAVPLFGRKKWTATSDLASIKSSQHQHHLLHPGSASTKSMHYSPTGAENERDYNQELGSFEDDEDLFRLDSSELSDLVNGQARGNNDDGNRGNDSDDQDNSIESFDDHNNAGSDGNLLAPNILKKLPTSEQQQQAADLDWVLGDSSLPIRAGTGALSDSSSSDKFKLAKFVQKIAPELSCYTGLGEHYHGHIATSDDNRICLNWYQVRLALAAFKNKNRTSQDGTSNEQKDRSINVSKLPIVSRNDNHNLCRNPNLDQGGPWCFVHYSESLDGQLLEPATQSVLPPQQQQSAVASAISKLTTQKQRIARVGANRQLFVIRPCNISSCSEYLWLYVVAPPLGLLIILICLIGLLVRAIRKSHYNAIFSAAYQRHSNSSASSGPTSSGSSNIIANRLGNVFKSRNRLANKRFDAGAKSSGKNKCNYLSDDIFEIVDDIDWSDANTQSQSMSPKSCELFKLNPSTVSPKSGTNKSTLTHSRSINPISTCRDLDEPKSGPKLAPQRTTSNMSKSKSQAGPMFATLRCHVRNTQEKRQVDSIRSQQQQAKKSRSFIDKCDLSTGNSDKHKQTGAGNCHDWIMSSMTSNLSSFQGSNIESSTPSSSAASPRSTSASAAKTGHLISCSSSSSSSNNIIATNDSNMLATNSANGSNLIDSGNNNKCILASDLPQMDAPSVTLACDTQPIYEGKFSQVLVAYLKQQDGDLTQATGRIGAQVAVCALKQQAALDEDVFVASNLRLRNLNHLNILRLIGFMQYGNEDSCTPETRQNNGNSSVEVKTCALVYDMAHLIDLSDWLKEQCKDGVIAQNDEISGDLSLKQNLSCLAKQIALAIDYLHDKDIVYKDLACRNCFLDVTRMLVKLASFNVELEFDDCQKSSSLVRKRLDLKSMVRPKYLLDYYVIDSRPSECQLLPLSWIPLESILFNKFNKQTDIWSFGCLLYELFSLGEVAYFGYSSKQVVDSVRSNLMPPQPLLCPNGIYKLMCICLSDIPTLRPNIKHIYEQLNLYSGQCSSFLNHHLCTI